MVARRPPEAGEPSASPPEWGRRGAGPGRARSPGMRSATATGSSQQGQGPPGPSERQKRLQSEQRRSPSRRPSQAGHSYTVSAIGLRASAASGRAAAWRRRCARLRQAAEQ